MLSSKSILVDIQTPFYDSKIKEWVNYYLKVNNFKISNHTVDLLISNYGDDISNTVNEIEKMYLCENSKNIKSDIIDSSDDASLELI